MDLVPCWPKHFIKELNELWNRSFSNKMRSEKFANKTEKFLICKQHSMYTGN